MSTQNCCKTCMHMSTDNIQGMDNGEPFVRCKKKGYFNDDTFRHLVVIGSHWCHSWEPEGRGFADEGGIGTRDDACNKKLAGHGGQMEVRREGVKMESEKTIVKVTDSAICNAKATAKEGVWLAAAMQVRKMVKDPTLAFLSKHGMSVGPFVETPAGGAVFAIALGKVLEVCPDAFGHAGKLRRVGAKLSELGAAELFDMAADVVFKPIREGLVGLLVQLPDDESQ